MRKQLLVLCPLLLITTAVWGSPIPMCTNNTLQYYITNYSSGCTLGSLTFSDFDFSSGGTQQPQPAASGVNVSTVTGADTGLSFDGPFGANAGFSLDALIGFVITSTTPSITNDTLTMEGYGANGMTGAGAQVAESLCIGGTYSSSGVCSGTSDSLDVNQMSPTATANFAATSELDVVKNIIVQGGPACTGTDCPSAGVSVVFNTTTSGGGGGEGGGETPEPDTVLSLGSGLVITSLLFRRKLRRNS